MTLPTPEQERAAIIAAAVFGLLAIIGAVSLLCAAAYVISKWVFG